MELNKENYLELRNTGKHTRPQMAGIFGISDSTLKRFISKNNLGKKLPIVKNKTVFREDTEQAAYWAGFLAADGCVDAKGRIRIYLQLSDVAHLEKFAEFVGSSHKINTNEERNRCSIEFTCSSMVADLRKWNIVPRKSVTYTPPENPNHLPHFMRGLFDGDGTICESFSNANSRTATLYSGLVCSYSCRDWFVRFADDLGITLKQHERDNCVNITMNTNKSKVFLTYMYEDSSEAIRLDRKYALYVKTVVNDDRETR